MAAPKGNKFSNGRPKGCKNKKTEQWELFSSWMMTAGLERFQEEMAKLEGKDFIVTVKDMMEYFQPKLARTEVTGKDGAEFKGVQVYLPSTNDSK